MAKSNFYNFNSVLAYNAVFHFIVGLRGVGKSFGAKERAIRDALKNGNQFVYLRRYKAEISTAKTEFFSDVSQLFPAFDFRVNANKAEAAPVSTREDKKREWVTLGFFIALSTSQNEKSVPRPRVKTIIFDEFIVEKGVIRYLNNEVKIMLDYYSSVARKREGVKVLFLANSVSIDNPYFAEYNIQPQDGTEFIRMHDGFIIVHFPDADNFKEEVYDTRFGRFIQGTEYANFAVENEFVDNHDALLDQKDSKARYLYTLETRKGLFSVWQNFFSGEFYIQSKLPKAQEIYTLIPEKMDSSKKMMLVNDRPMQMLRKAFRDASVSFDKPATRNTFTEIFRR